MPATTPCLWFDGQAEEAATFYTQVFPNSSITDVTRYGPGAPLPEGTALTVGFSLDGQRYTALNGGPQFSFTEAVSFQIACADQDEVDHYWDRLTDGGEESQCGWLKDRFGLSWQVVPDELPALLADPDPERAQRAMQAMLAMRKIDVAAVRRAADGDAVAAR
jgi:predicted 3-demethylubiquinone-9 3-methyltransferase (glyoxalase superfamily)